MGASPVCLTLFGLKFETPRTSERTTSSGMSHIIDHYSGSISQARHPSVDGEFELVFGTSCSSPVVGALLTLINDARIAQGKGPVGEQARFSEQCISQYLDFCRMIRIHQPGCKHHDVYRAHAKN